MCNYKVEENCTERVIKWDTLGMRAMKIKYCLLSCKRSKLNVFESSSLNAFRCFGKYGNLEMCLVNIPIYNRWKGGKCGSVTCPEIHV